MRTRTTWGQGERAPKAKLTATLVRAIVQELSAGSLQRDVADRYDVTREAVSDINRGATWSHVTGRTNASKRKPKGPNQ